MNSHWFHWESWQDEAIGREKMIALQAKFDLNYAIVMLGLLNR